MSSASVTPLIELSPELFPEIIGHLPLVYYPSTLLSLALTCHRLHNVICPQLLYNNVRLVGEDQSLSTLRAMIAKAEEDIRNQGNPPPSHSIHHLCIDSVIKGSIRPTDNSLNALQNLVDLGGLRQLSALTLQVIGAWDWAEGDDSTNEYLKLPTSFCTDLKVKCPNLKSLHVSYPSQEFGKEWIEPDIFSVENLTSIRIEGYLLNYPLPTINLSQLPPNLQILELRLRDAVRGKEIDASGPGGLLGCVIPNLRALILDKFFVSDPTSTNAFWRAHPGIERLEFWLDIEGNWFNDFEVGMLPNLRYLQCNANQALVLLPQVSDNLIRLSLWGTYNAQGPYLMRAIAPNGILPTLRSLAIRADSGNSPKPREGHKWREDEDGNQSEADPKRPVRRFDGNYIMSLSKAAPNLEELELMGSSNDTMDSITASLSRFPKLHRLTLSGGTGSYDKPFIASAPNWKYDTEFDNPGTPVKYEGYAPDTFEEAAHDLANGCPTLNIVTISTYFGELLIRGALSARIVRQYDGGPVMGLEKIRAWGNIIGKEEEW